MAREDRMECWDEWKEANELLRLRRDGFYAELRTGCVSSRRAWVGQKGLIETLQDETCAAKTWNGGRGPKNLPIE